MKINYGTVFIEDDRLEHQVKIHLDRTNDGYMATDDITKLWGDGVAVDEAIESYIRSLIECRDLIRKMPKIPGEIQTLLTRIENLLSKEEDEND